MNQKEWDRCRAAIREADGMLRDLASQERRAKIQIQEAKGRYEEAARHLRQAIAKAVGIDIWDLSIGTWDCRESPIGKCFYDQRLDPCNDFCLVCGDPDERK